MKRLSLKNLNLKADEILQRHQLKSLLGGYGDGECAVFVRTDDGHNYWSACTYSVSYAQNAYATGGDPLYGGYSITGYCCASCSHC